MFTDMEHNFIFRANYSVNSEVELSPVGGPVVAFGPDGTNPNIGLDGSPLCMISPVGRAAWMASFKFGTPIALSGVFSTPNPEILCVVAGGFGYWVDVFQRTKSDIRCFPIRQVRVFETLIYWCLPITQGLPPMIPMDSSGEQIVLYWVTCS